MSLPWRLSLFATVVAIAIAASGYLINSSLEKKFDKRFAMIQDTVSQLRQEVGHLRMVATLEGWQLNPNDTIVFCGVKYPLSNKLFRERLQYELSIMFGRQGWLSEQVRNLGRYQPLIQYELELEDLPSDLIYMFVWESGLNPRARSWAGAVGIGQFIRSAAIEFKIPINSRYDERMNTQVAVHASCQYLKTYYPYFNDWLLTLAAYNHGPYGIRSKLTDQGVAKYEDLFLPQETSHYVFQILAVHYAIESRLLGDTSWLILHPPLPPTERIIYRVAKTMTLMNLSQALGLDYYTFRLLNHHFLQARLAPGKYPINLPINRNDGKSLIQISPPQMLEGFVLTGF